MTKRTQRMIVRTIVLLAGLLWPVAEVSGQTNDGQRILFLHLKLQSTNTIKLMNSMIRPGELKPPANMEFADGIHYELLDATGKTLWHAAIPDPSQRSIEHAGHANAGKLKQLRVELPESEFMVRVPFRTNAIRVEFYRLVAATTNAPLEKMSLGAFPVPRE